MSTFSPTEGPERTASIAAWFQGLYPYLEEAPPLVDGAAVELYTGGAYRTSDLDFVGRVPDPVRAALEEAGFRRRGRHWVREMAETAPTRDEGIREAERWARTIR